MNISKYGLYRASTKPPILQCPNVIKWMTRRIDHERRTILNFGRKNVSSYQGPVLDQMYHFKEPQVRVTQEWLQRKIESINFLTIMKGWWLEWKCILKPTPARWRTSKF